MYSRPLRRQSKYVELYFVNPRNTPAKVNPHTAIAEIEGFLMYSGHGYAVVKYIPDIGRHKEGRYRMINLESDTNLNIVALSQICRKGHMVTVRRPTRGYTVVRAANDNSNTGTRVDPFRVLCFSGTLVEEVYDDET